MKPTEQQVYQWFIEQFTGDITPADEAALTAALTSDPALRARWDAFMEEAKELDISTFARGLNAETGLESLKARMSPGGWNTSGRNAGGRVKKFPAAIRISAAAAVLFVLLGAGYLALFRHPSIYNKEKIMALVQKNKPTVNLVLGNGRSVNLAPGKNGLTIQLANATMVAAGDSLKYASGSSGDTTQNVLSVPAGGKYKLSLSDGTQVFLNSATTLRFPFQFPGGSREVYLTGEAYFKIAPDAHRPFIVHTLLTKVQVLGTSFDVNTYVDGKVRTALVDGKVLAMGSDGKTVALTPGNAASYDASKGFTTEKFDQDDELSWMKGIYYFHDMPVADLARLASRCYGVHIIVANERLSAKSVTGLLETGKMLEFLNDLETTAHIKCRYTGNDLFFE